MTGARGMLGQALRPNLETEHEVLGVDIQDFDIAGRECPERIVELRPQAVMHLAAMTDVDGCERDPQRAMAINGHGTRQVAEACRHLGIPLLYISTDFVFDGAKRTPYVEDDPPHPLGHYGRSKLAGEKAVSELLSRYFIVRTSWLFGPGGKNFVATVLRRAQETGGVRVVADQTGSPTYTRDLAWALARLVASDRYGIYHLTNSGCCTWYQLAAEAVRMAGIQAEVTPISSSEYPTPTKRPDYSVLENARWQREFGRPLRPWTEALKDYIERSWRKGEEGGQKT